jgi:hypothetical protein
VLVGTSVRTSSLKGTQWSHGFCFKIRLQSSRFQDRQILQLHTRSQLQVHPDQSSAAKTYPKRASFGSGLFSSAAITVKSSGKPENGIFDVASSQRREPSENTSDLSDSGLPSICLRSQSR